jgi:hypothetical protein
MAVVGATTSRTTVASWYGARLPVAATVAHDLNNLEDLLTSVYQPMGGYNVVGVRGKLENDMRPQCNQHGEELQDGWLALRL